MNQLSHTDLNTLASLRQYGAHIGALNSHLLGNQIPSHLASQMSSHMVNPNMVNLGNIGLVGVPPHLATSNYSQSTANQANILTNAANQATPTVQPTSATNAAVTAKVNQVIPQPQVVQGIPTPQVSGPPGGTGGNQSQQLQAITYVTKIRNRFSDEPETYKHFLKILHTYQKEQKGIKEVLEQVSLLFADHPDLLMEFTYFLPDAVQDQAKERLERAVKESEARKLSKQTEKIKLSKKNQNLLPQSNYNLPPGMIPGQPGYEMAMMNQEPSEGKKADKKTRIKKKDKEKEMSIDLNDSSNLAYARLASNALLANKQLGSYQPGDVPIVKSELSSVSSAEAHFFSTVKDILLGISKNSWIEFVKCLDMYTNEAITKEEMLLLIGDILGPNHRDILVEFQRLLENKAVYMEEKENIWFGVPLSEIDFSQCRKCTPSYRALPKDYPRFKSSHFNEPEVKELNNSWVSIPIGSEESYSFKHMRKNQYEEALFKFEDEKFELDMLIDSNTSTIRVLEPLAEEILKAKALNPKNPSSLIPRFSLQLEERMLSTIHLNSISRIYGDHGDEILELLKKNPVATIPIVLKRLQQKEKEWKKTRQDLNKTWKEIVEKNHYKSFDHRSFYFRQQDKKYISSKNLLNEITSRENLISNNNESNKPIYDDSSLSGVGFYIDSELTHLLGNMKPSMALIYENDTHLIHRDIYKIICHIIHSSVTSSLEKEKLSILCRDLFRIFFNIPLHYLYEQTPPVVSSSTSTSTKIPGYKIPLISKNKFPNNETHYKIGTYVLTIYGKGPILSYREEDNIYCVEVSFGKVYLTESNILGYNINNIQELKESSPPVTSPISESTPDYVVKPCHVFYGTQICYIFFRLHHILYVRLRTAFLLSQEATNTNSHHINEISSSHSIIRESIDENDPHSLTSSTSSSIKKSSLYSNFLKQVYGLVEGSIDQSKFEDYCRTNLGNKSYVLYTLDRLLSQFMKQLHIMANDENVQKLVSLFDYHNNIAEEESAILGSTRVDAAQYKKDLSIILNHSLNDDYMYRIQFLSPLTSVNYNVKTEVAIEQFPVSFGDDGEDKKKEGKKRKSLSALNSDINNTDEKKRKKKKKKDETNDTINEDDEEEEDNEKLKKKRKLDDKKENNNNNNIINSSNNNNEVLEKIQEEMELETSATSAPSPNLTQADSNSPSDINESSKDQMETN